MSDERSESRVLILIIQKSLQNALLLSDMLPPALVKKLPAVCIPKSDQKNILKVCSNHHLWCLSFFWCYLSNFFVASFLLAYISVTYVWWPNQKRYFVTINFLITTEVILSLRQRNQTFYMSKGKIGTHKSSFPFLLAFTMRCFKSSKICWLEINIAKLTKYW